MWLYNAQAEIQNPKTGKVRKNKIQNSGKHTETLG